jgi:hypothetical protein
MPLVKGRSIQAKLTAARIKKPTTVKSRYGSIFVGVNSSESDKVAAEAVDFITRREGKSQTFRLDKACELLPEYFEALALGSNYEATSIFDSLALYCHPDTRRLLEQYRDVVKDYVKEHVNDDEPNPVDEVTAANISDMNASCDNEVVLMLRRFISSLNTRDFLPVVA